MRSNNQLLHGDQTTRGENYFTVNADARSVCGG